MTNIDWSKPIEYIGSNLSTVISTECEYVAATADGGHIIHVVKEYLTGRQESRVFRVDEFGFRDMEQLVVNKKPEKTQIGVYIRFDDRGRAKLVSNSGNWSDMRIDLLVGADGSVEIQGTAKYQE